MNECAANLGMKQTYFDSPHGLQNVENISTAYDMCKLCAICMKGEYFRQIVSTKVYECTGVRRYATYKYPKITEFSTKIREKYNHSTKSS